MYFLGYKVSFWETTKQLSRDKHGIDSRFTGLLVYWFTTLHHYNTLNYFVDFWIKICYSLYMNNEETGNTGKEKPDVNKG